MRRTRFMSLFFLVLATAFFLVAEFRQALKATPVILALESGSWSLARVEIPPARLEALAREAESQKDARKLAFAALHARGHDVRARYAGLAVALDPAFTWIYFSLLGSQRDAPQAAEWIRQLQAWDADNAVPWLIGAERIHEARKLSAHIGIAPEAMAALAQETEWRSLMEKAFAAPRFDGYIARRFELERKILLELGLAEPARMLISLASYPISNLPNMRLYSNLLILKLGRDAEEARRWDDAARQYWTVARFGERMQLGGRALIEQLMATHLQTQAYERLAPLLRRMGRDAEAATLEFIHRDLRRRVEVLRGADPLRKSSKLAWAGLNVVVFSVLVYVFGVATAVCVFYVNLKRWIRTEKKGRLYQFITVAENYVPILLFLACLGLYLSYYPYAQDFRYYLTAEGTIDNFEPFFSEVVPSVSLLMVAGANHLRVENPFRTYLWYALAGLALMIAADLLGKLRSKKQG